jgi:bifunctional UDP-N-acetylglucosamine pyrophosphorylase/glucosamine-1-phosphate N-acetyltransferase
MRSTYTISTLEKLMDQGVTIIDTRTTYISDNVKIGKDSVIHPHTIIEGPAVIGAQCTIGPFARIRPGVELGKKVTIGNFVEIVRSKVGDATQIKHLTYVGDADIASDVNVGAGTVTANFDGKKKHKTVIGKNSKIGSGTLFVAPVTLGRNTATGAGSVLIQGSKVKDGTTVAGVPAKELTKAVKKMGKKK